MRTSSLLHSIRRRFTIRAHSAIHRRKGIAMAVALMAVVLLGTMVAGAAYFSMQNGRQSDNGRRVLQATVSAEAATAQVIHNWNIATYNALAKGASTSIPQATISGSNSVYQGTITKLTDKLYLIDLTVWDTTSSKLRGQGARQRLSTLARIVQLQMPTSSALTISDTVKFGGGNSIVAGADAVPAGWTCPSAGAAVTGVRAGAPGDIQGSAGQYTGNPNSLITPGLDSTVYTQFGNTSYAQLAANATFTLSPGSYAPGPVLNGAVCNRGVNTNWGDGANPTAACGTFFPVVYINGGAGSNTTLSSGQGQGILLVDGNLTVSGTWTYYGLVIVKGVFKTSGTGAPKVYGTVLAKKVDFSSTSSGNAAAVINYSSCSLDRTFNATSKGGPLRNRGYIRMM